MEVERLAAVFIREGDFLVEPNCKTTIGLWVSADPVVSLPRTASAVELGAAARWALSASRQGIPHDPGRWRGFGHNA